MLFLDRATASRFLAQTSQPRIDRLALQRQHSEHALMDPPQRLAGDKAPQRFVAERELAQGEVALAAKAALAQPHQVVRRVVFGTVDDAEVL